MECHRIANGLIRPGQELPDDFDLDILESEEYKESEVKGRDPLIGLNFMIWKSQEFLQAPNMID
jgi:hypothetical protein